MYNAQYNNESADFVHAGERQRGLLEQAGNFLPGKEQLQSLREELEGPKPLRVIAGLGGLALCIGSALGLLWVFDIIDHPAQFVLRAYETLFGATIAVVELKAFFKQGNKFSEFCYKWFPFLTILGGKGAFYLFAGCLGLGFGWKARAALIVFAPAAFCAVMGVVYILFHFGRCSSLREKYDQTVVLKGDQGPRF